MPVLVMESSVRYNYMETGLPQVVLDCSVAGILDSGHYMFEENSDQLFHAVFGFFKIE
jgi:hypothetical protein